MSLAAWWERESREALSSLHRSTAQRARHAKERIFYFYMEAHMPASDDKKRPDITLCKCNSSQIAEHGYDADSQTLAIRFKSGGKLYHYAGVSRKDYDALTGAKSLGKHFHTHIREKFPFQCVS